MSLLTTNLFRQNNKNNVYGERVTGSTRNTIRGTWAYANKYDALYNKYSQYKNFNFDTWLEALRLGEQDTYLSFLEQNKDTQMSDQFYDPQYYSYERNMLELSKPFADATNLDDREDGSSREYFEQVFDYEKNDWVQQSIGKMTDRQYIEYTLAKNDEMRSAEITRNLEQIRKDQIGWWNQFGHSALATLAEFGEGLLTGLAGIVDFAVAVGSLGFVPLAVYEGEGDYLDAFVEYFGRNGFTAAEKRTVRDALDEYERKYTLLRDIDGNYEGIGQAAAGIANSIGMMIPAIIMNVVTGGAAFVGTATFYVSIFSNNMYENATDPARVNSPSWVKVTDATLKAAAEAVIEYGLGALLGGTIQNKLIGISGKTAVKGLTRWTGIQYVLKSALQEGLEEFLQDFGTECIDQFIGIWYEGYGNTGVTFQTLVDSFVIGAISSVIMSGGAAINGEIRSAIANKKNPGSGDLLIETEKGIQKVRGFNRLYFGQILSDFKDIVDKLKSGKLSLTKNIELAQEVYSALSAISQFYMSFDKGRIKNCEMLLDRIVKAGNKTPQEIFGEKNERAAMILSRKTIDKIIKNDEVVKDEIATRKDTTQTVIKMLTRYMENTFNEMLSSTSSKYKEQFHTVVNKNAEKLNDAGVTKMTGVMDENGKLYGRTEDIEEVEELIGKAGRDMLEELHEEYPFIVITDGHIAIEDDDFLFVPEAWLENYEISDIYKFLTQGKILNAVETDVLLKPMISELIKFDKEFTKQENVTAERAIMDFLFNKSVYQAFLLKKVGKRDAGAMAFKKFIFRLHNIIKENITRSGVTNWRDKPSQKRINFAKQIYEQIKETMREPTIKAIFNWNLDPQVIGADNILDKTDREFINRYKAKMRALAGLTSISAQSHLLEQVLSDGGKYLTREEISIIEAAKSPNATEEDKILAYLMTQTIEDYRNDVYRYVYGPFFKEDVERDLGKLVEAKRNGNSKDVDKYLRFIEGYVEELRNILPEFDFGYTEFREAVQTARNNNELSIALTQLKDKIDKGIAVIREFDYFKEFSDNLQFKIVTGALAELDTIDAISQKSDALRAFEQRYGVSARSVWNNDFTNMSTAQARIFAEDMNILGITDNRQFVRVKLEQLLNKNFIVVPTTDDGFVICSKIAAKDILIDELLVGDTIYAQNENIFAYYNSVKERKGRVTVGDLVKFTSTNEQISNILNTEVEIDEKFFRSGYSKNKNTVYISRQTLSLLDDLVHEVNHVIQDEYGIVGGGTPDMAGKNTSLINRVKRDFSMAIDLYERLHKVSRTEATNTIAYYILTGEFLSFSGKDTPNISVSFGVDDINTIKARKLRGQTISTDNRENLQGFAEYKLVKSFYSIIRARNAIRDSGYTEHTSRHTFHTRLSNMSADDILSTILNDSLPTTMYVSATINDIILNPEIYLSPEILAEIGEDLSEGNVFYELKHHLENKFGNISIDRTSDTHEYTLVDDNAFDDLLNDRTRALRNGKEKSLYKKVHDEHVSLAEFYSTRELTRLGIPSSTKVFISPSVKSETKEANGVVTVYIRADENTPDNKIIDTLNHEFRHVAQIYNGLETGFTSSFIVTDEMLDDVEKHIPSLFTTNEAKNFAKHNGKDYKKKIVQQFVYSLTGGELNAYGIDLRTAILNTKPIYVAFEAGKPTIYMPWYNAQTGEGRHKTDFLANRADDETPWYNRKSGKSPKYKEKKQKGTSKEGKPIYNYSYTERRDFSMKKAKGTNLEYFVKKGQRNQMDPDLQEFVIGTTGHEDKLPPEITHAIKKGVLTKQDLFEWFRTVDAEQINDFTFDLINDTMFHNEYITSIDALDDLLVIDPSFYWAAIIVLRSEGLKAEKLLEYNSTTNLRTFLSSLEGTKWRKAIEQKQLEFNNVSVQQMDGSYKKQNIAASDFVNQWMRVFVMRYFDGTLASAWYMANEYRKVMTKYEEEQIRHDSLDRRTRGKEDDGDTLGERISADKIKNDGTAAVISDIVTLYNLETNQSVDDMIDEMLRLNYPKLVDKLIESHTKMSEKEKTVLHKMLTDEKLRAKYKELNEKETLTDAELRKLKIYEYAIKQQNKVLSALETLRNQMLDMTEDELRARYSEIMNAEMTDTTVPESALDVKDKSYSKSRAAIASRIKTSAKHILKLVTSGRLPFDSLPKEVQDMFEYKTYTSEDGKKTQVLEIKPEVYSVGRGRATLSSNKDSGRFNYVRKKDLRTDNSVYRHNVDKIFENDTLLRDTLREARKAIKNKTTGDIKKTIKTIRKYEKKLSDVIDTARTSKKNQLKETRIRVRPAKRTSDVPNNFTIVSSIDMPVVLKDIFDTSFEDMADTRVQFASKDEAGNLYDKKTHGNKFDSRLKHEVSNWQTFYEANRDVLIGLTRSDAFDIIEFFQYGMSTVNGHGGKLRAFELFMIGYIYDVAQKNTLGWNFSEAEINVIRELWESKASELGSGLNAVGQMQEVINPFKTVEQRMLDDFNITDDELKPYEDALTKLQRAKNNAERRAAAVEVAEQIKTLEQKMADRDPRPKGWVKKLFTFQWKDLPKGWKDRAKNEVKAFRFLSMLSSPLTWIRNQVSNIAMTGLNSASDAIGSMVFAKKGYRDNQWDLAGVKTDENVKLFIDAYIKNDDTFNKYLYDSSGRYDDYSSKKNSMNEHTMFVRMITSAIEQKYAANNRFDTEVFNTISKFVSRMISDKTFIKFATSRYFGKILTIEVNNGNIDLSKGLTDNVLELFAEAVVMANADYMHKRSFLADTLTGLKDKHPKIYEALTLWQPFLNSSFNWFQEALKYTPIGLIGSIINMSKLEKRITEIDARRERGDMIPTSRVTEYLARRDIGKGIIGLLFSILGAILAGTGVLKIEDDDDKFYVVAGDVKVDISNVFGTSSILIGASIAQIWAENEKTTWNSIEDALRLMTTQMFEGFILNDLLARHKWDEGFWDGLLTETESVLRSFVPQMWQLIIRCTNNEEIRYSAGMAGMWERWLNSFVPAQPLGHRKINPYTGEVESKYALPIVGELLRGGLLGPKIYWYEMSDIEEYARELGVNKNELTGELTVGDTNYKLDRIALNEKYGELNKASLTKITSQKHRVEMPNGTFKTLSWDRMSDKQRANVISRTMTQNATLAKVYVWTQIMGNKYYGSDALYQTLRRLGIFKNVYNGDKGFVK